MALYRILAYVGSVWSLIAYGTLLTLGIIFSVMLNILMPVLRLQVEAYLIMTSLSNSALLVGTVGTAVSIVAIIATRKIVATKKLTIILIVAGIVFVILEWFQYSVMADIFNVLKATAPYYGTAEAQAEAQFFSNLAVSFFRSLIPTILLIVSGILAFRIYSKPNNYK